MAMNTIDHDLSILFLIGIYAIDISDSSSTQLIIHLFWPVVDRNVFIILPTLTGY